MYRLTKLTTLELQALMFYTAVMVIAVIALTFIFFYYIDRGNSD